MASDLSFMSSSSNALSVYIQRAQEWARIDPHAKTRVHVEELVAAALSNDAAALQVLQKLFASCIQFGTAGMRGVMEAGSAGLNYVTALRMAQGTCDMLLAEASRKGQTASDVSVVVGFDHRSNCDNGINSKNIAMVITAAFVSRGVRVHLFSDFCHTPLVPFSVVNLNATAGIMVTASHNPKLDNGIKVYAKVWIMMGACVTVTAAVGTTPLAAKAHLKNATVCSSTLRRTLTHGPASTIHPLMLFSPATLLCFHQSHCCLRCNNFTSLPCIAHSRAMPLM
jgi:hypothetical protein